MPTYSRRWAGEAAVSRGGGDPAALCLSRGQATGSGFEVGLGRFPLVLLLGVPLVLGKLPALHRRHPRAWASMASAFNLLN